MKIIKTIVFLFFAVIFAGTISVFSQSSCQCSGFNCSASQTCNAGYTAVCTCSSSGCSSSCSKDSGDIPEGPPQNRLIGDLQNDSVKNIGSNLSKIFGKIIVFEPTERNFRFNSSAPKLSEGNHWDVFEYLAANGKLTINGQDLEFWKGLRRTLLDGGEFAFCSSSASAQRILSEISFISGKKFSITSGDPKTKISGPINGSSLSEVIESLSKSTQTTIAEN